MPISELVPVLVLVLMQLLLLMILVVFSGSDSDALVVALDVFLRTADSSSLKAEARSVTLSVVPLQDQPAFQDQSPEEIREETADALGLSPAVFTVYTSLLDDLEVYRDQVRVQELDARISTARSEMNAALVLQLRQQRKALVSTTSELNAKISASSLAQRVQAAVKECTAFYMHLTDSDSFDVAFAQRCKRTMEYLKLFLTIMGDRLQVGQRLRERRVVDDDGTATAFPANVQRIAWADLSLSGSLTDCVLDQGSFGRVVRAQWSYRGIVCEWR